MVIGGHEPSSGAAFPLTSHNTDADTRTAIKNTTRGEVAVQVADGVCDLVMVMSASEGEEQRARKNGSGFYFHLQE